MTTVATNNTHEKETKPKADTKSPFEAKAPEKAPKAKLDASEAVRLMLTTLKRVEPTDRAKVLATLAALA